MNSDRTDHVHNADERMADPSLFGCPLAASGVHLNTEGMRGRPGRGAVIGLAVGVGLTGLLIVLPRMLDGDYYEVTDQLVVMGVPLLVIGPALGALIGAPGRTSVAEVHPGPVPRRSVLAVGVGTATAVVACVLAVWLFLWGTGIVKTALPWIN